MSNRTFLAAAATLFAACASGGPAPGESAAAGDSYRYEVPTPPTATYRLADTTTMIIGMPDGEMDMAMSSASTVELTFAADSGGVRATGTVSDYSSSMASTMLGNVDMSGVDISGDLEFVVGPLGDVEMISTPEVTGADLPTSMPFQFNAQEMFPRFPDRRLQPGDMWADTVIESLDLEALGLPVPLPGMGEDTTIYNYTLLGDTLVDGRTLPEDHAEQRRERANLGGRGRPDDAHGHEQHPGRLHSLGRRARTGCRRGPRPHHGRNPCR